MLQFFAGHPPKDGRVADLIAVQMQDRQHRAVTDRVQEFVALPGGGQRAGFGLAVANRDGGDQVRVVEHGAKGVGDRIAQLAALIDRTRGFGRDMARDAAGEAELLEQLAHTFLITADVRVHLRIGAVQISVCNKEVAAMARPEIKIISWSYFLITRFRCTYTKFWPGTVPQWPTIFFLTSSRVSGRRSSGLSSR